MASDRQRIGIACGGGGLWGISEIGVMDVLQQEDVPIDMLAGASMGAIVAALTSAHIDDRQRLTRDGVEYMIDVAAHLRTLDQLTVHEQGRTRLALDSILNPSGDDARYASMMARGPQVPYWAQVREVDGERRSEQFLHARRGTPMERTLQFASASAALKPKFGIDPVTVDGERYADDKTIAWKSTHTATQKLRSEGADGVIGVAVGFIDTSGLGKLFQRVIDTCSPTLRDRGDVVIEPKEGRGPFNGHNSLTNFGRGFALAPEKFARDESEIRSGKRIPIPTEEFIEAGRQATRKQLPALHALLRTLGI